MIKRKQIFKYLGFFLIFVGILAFRFVLAQNYGVDEVGTQLGGSLGETNTDPRALATRIINISLGFLGIIALIIILYAGFLWMTSGGNEEKIAKARKTLIAGVIGLVIILSSWGLASWLIKTISDTTNGTGGDITYEDGDSRSCGCVGYQLFNNGSWGSCLGEGDCSGPGGGLPESCDANGLVSGCQVDNDICGASAYCNDECVCETLGDSGDSCNLSGEEGVCQASDDLCGQYLTCNPDSCVCEGSPVITGISPVGGFCQNEQNKSCQDDSDCEDVCNLTAPNGAPSNFLTISGQNFGEYDPELSRVIFVGNNNLKEGVLPDTINPNCISFWRNDQIIIAIPEGAGTGPIKIIDYQDKSDQTNDEYGPIIPDFRSNNIVRPGLCEIDPVSGKLSAEISYSGVNLYNGRAYFGNYNSNVKALSSDFENNGLTGKSVIPNIEAGESGSFVKASISGNEENSNYLTFIKEREENEGSFISYFKPLDGNAGQYVTIYGSGFGRTKGAKSVYFGETEASYDFPEVCLNSVWSEDEITVKVPAGLEDDDYIIRVELDETSISTEELNPDSFEFDKNKDLKTSLCKIDPERGTINTEVSLWGEYFGDKDAEVLVSFNGSADYISEKVEKDGRADLLQTSVPEGAITGPVKVKKNNEYGNELNFTVGKCSSNSDCGGQFCCPEGTYKEGSCVSNFGGCYVDVPSSVYEWSFSTTFSETIPDADSCAGLAQATGFCSTGMCPNVPGMCSPYSGGEKVYGEDCSYDCTKVIGCRLGEKDCSYNVNLDKCLQILEGDESNNCNLEKDVEYEFNGETINTTATCNNNGNWEINVSTTCPENYDKGIGDICYNPESECRNCEDGLSCQLVGGSERCVSEKLCDEGSVCESENGLSNGQCVSITSASCECCCTIGKSARDCCSFQTESEVTVQLECGGTCGSASDVDNGYGVCGGCAAASDSSAELRDAACSCSGHSGQYCEVNDDAPEGYCTDCSSLSSEACVEHADVCCLDSNGTEETSDDICRGGVGDIITDNENSGDYGYCAYYDCSDDSTCASSTPLKVGGFLDVNKCETGCAVEDPCSGINNYEDCVNQATGNCCFDNDSNECKSGEAIDNSSDNDGYCAYYDCMENEDACDSSTPSKNGDYLGLNECEDACEDPQIGADLECVNTTSKIEACNTSLCGGSGLSCLTDTGALGPVGDSDCGVCCCDPSQENNNSGVDGNLICLANQGACTGGDRGLYCGCESDSQCGNIDAIGCGLDTCCHARPEIVSTNPEHLADNVCRNASLRVQFNQLMSAESVTDNVILIEEKINANEPCDNGTFIASANSIDGVYDDKINVFAKVSNFFKNTYRKVASLISPSFNRRALASPPSEDNLYCLVPGNASLENDENTSTIVYNSNTLLDASTNYYLVIKGDEVLDSNTGVFSLDGIGFNGSGYEGSEEENIKFNQVSYKNSHIIKFSTISDQETSGICLIDRMELEPVSYLFNTHDDALDSDELDEYGVDSFDTQADRDKVWTANAYSDSQVIRPVIGYYWDYNFTISNDEIVSGEKLEDMPDNQYFVSAQDEITDGHTKLNAVIDMNPYSEDGGCSFSSSCADNNNCCNDYLKGDGFSDISDIYVFICNNPWPKKSASGLWSPWKDTDDNCSVGDTNCNDFNYSFYYCRDAGKDGTFDDLPAVLNDPVIIGQKDNNDNLVCSSDRSATCESVNDSCGEDANNDGISDGICIWNVLKESYFFREELPSSGEITRVIDLKTGGAIKIEWQSNVEQVASYKIYYIKSGDSNISFKEVGTDVCNEIDSTYKCEVTLSGLENEINYSFRIGVISTGGAESQAINERIKMPTDKEEPPTPVGLSAEVEGDRVKISWEENEDDNDTYFYRLYMGTTSGIPGKSFDTSNKDDIEGNELNSLYISKEEFSSNINYLSLSAFDRYNNESEKTDEETIDVRPATPTDLNAELGEEGNNIKITWTENDENVYFYRLYLGNISGQYTKSFDTDFKIEGEPLNSLNISKDEFYTDTNYLSLTAFDKFDFKSNKSDEITFTFEEE
ncbi:MAG: IPT/TIG domain-containing protein [Patescibacteria group bacterium]|jgi:hypothetical protein|nr:IPT/TIG domain-containing protein [Patescibacteria group bacterium]